MSMKVLIADPDSRFAHQASAFLESHAHTVVWHSQADTAIETARHWQPDLAIVSEELVESGLLEKLRALPDPPAVLLVVWMDSYKRLWRAWQRGGDELLIKPIFNANELHAAIVAAEVRHQRLAISA